MGLKEDLEADVAEIFRKAWSEREGTVVPEPEDLKLGNDAVKLDGVVLYADMSDSTKLVDNETASFAAEVYKSYLMCAARIVKAEGGAITAYDGDRIMAVFIGNMKNTNAATAGLKINYAAKNIVNPALAKQYPTKTYRLEHVVGIDASSLFVARIGVRNDNDLVWVGRAANYAAKLCAVNEPNTVFITKTVFDSMHESAKYGGDPKRLMWEARTWTKMNNMSIYRSIWTWVV
jgi:class 3 adenylate cyclase